MNISVVIPVFNGEHTIIRAVESVINQKFTFEKCHVEIVIVNDGSTDKTLPLLKEYVSKHSFENISILTIENGGVSKARNYGINHAKFDWIAFLDADDIWHENKLEIQLKYLHEISPTPAFIGSARNNEVLSLYGKKITTLYKARLVDLLIKIFPQTSTALVRKDVLLKCGLYDTAMTHSEDADLWVRICSIGEGFYYHPESTTSTGDGKHNFGDSGLSANLHRMEQGAVHMLKKVYRSGNISLALFCSLYLFYKIKYVRRLLIVSLRRKK